MKISKVLLWAVLSLSILFVPACKKEKDDNRENKLVFTIDKTEIYQYSTLIAESVNQNISDFDKKIFINGKDYPAEIVDNKYIAFVIFPDVAIGNAKLSFTVDGEKHDFDIQVLPLPDISNPDVTLVNYKTDLDILYQESLTALDSVNKRMGIQPDAAYYALKDDVKKINDSINIAINRFNNLDPDAKLIAARIFEANRLSLKSSFETIHEINQVFIKNKLSGRDVTLCLDDIYNTSEKFECIFKSLKKSLQRLIRECIFNGMKAGIISAGIGVVVTAVTANPAAGWKAGSAAAFPLLAAFSAKSLLTYLSQMISVYNTTVEVSENEISNYRQAPATFYNDEDLAVKFSIKRRNIKESDKSSKYTFISDLVITLGEFNNMVETYFKNSVSKIPTFGSQTFSTNNVEDLKYISVSVKDNASVKLTGITGTTEKPIIRFTSNFIEDQNFTYTVNYNDGVFQTQEEYAAVLKTRIGITLNDTILGGKSSIIKFKVFCPENMNWTISNQNSWIIVLPNNGKGKNESCDLAVQDNFTGSARTGYITFTAGNYTKTISINQSNQLKIIYRSIERTLQSSYSGIMMSFDSDTAILNYTPGPGEANLNFKLIAKSISSLYKAGFQSDTIGLGKTELAIYTENNDKIFPYTDIDHLTQKGSCTGIGIGYSRYKYIYFTGPNVSIDGGLFKSTDSTVWPSYYISTYYHKMMNRKLSMPWCDMAPYPAPQNIPMGTSNIYLPIRVKNNTVFHYGWIRISTIGYYAFKIHDYAIHSEPNAPIKTGEK